MTKPFQTRTFRSGNSVAVRLPKGFAIPEGAEVELQHAHGTVTMRLMPDREGERARLRKLLDDLEALGAPIEIEKREPIYFPDRPGLY